MKSLTSRTTLITALAVAGVLVAGTAAIAANIGILNSTDDSSIGSLSATDDLVDDTTTTTAVATTLATTTTTSLADPAPNAGESYVVDDAGVVTLSSASGNLTLVSAVPEAGWTVTFAQPDVASLEVTFTNGARTVVFSAVLGADGVVTADVVEPVTVIGAPAATPTTSPSAYTLDRNDDGYEYEDDDDEYDDDEYDDDEYDDDHEDDDDHYEGADDDD